MKDQSTTGCAKDGASAAVNGSAAAAEYLLKRFLVTVFKVLD